MIINAYLVIDPQGDRPYLTTTPPSEAMKKANPNVRVFHYLLHVPDAVPPDNTGGVPGTTPIVVPES